MKRVKIGKRHYKVTKKRLAKDTFSDCDTKIKEIRITHDVHPRARARKLLHEIYHGIFAEYLPDVVTDDEEEKIVSGLERGLKDFAINNQAAWLKIAIGLMKK